MNIQQWLVQRVAFYVERPPTEIDPTARLRSYGLDSVYALNLCVDVEEDFGLLVEPTLAWDYPTIEALAGYLTTRIHADHP